MPVPSRVPKPAEKQAPRSPQPEFAPEAPVASKIHPILTLQRTLGNRRVAALIHARRLAPNGRILPFQRSGGQPLDSSTRAFFEPRFERSFSNVRVHTDRSAAESAKSIRAPAYAAGTNIAFDSGQYQPGTSRGQSLIAHELTRVVQRSESSSERIHRLGDPNQAPMVLPCNMAEENAPSPTETIFFANNNAELTKANKTKIVELVEAWQTLGKGVPVRVDGYASTPGGQALNWSLSCGRAGAVKDQLVHPSEGALAGIPEGSITLFMHGETVEFGSDESNRRVNIFMPSGSPGKPTPVEPVPTPGPNEPPQVNPPAKPASAQTSDCTDPQKTLITGAVQTARSNINAVLPKLAANPLSADIQNALWLYFRDDSVVGAKTVFDNLSKIAGNLDKVTFECESDCPQDEMGYTRLGTMVAGIGSIHLCTNNLKQDPESISDTIIHELAHYSLLASDSAGYYQNDCTESGTTVSAGSSTKVSLADSYNCFVRNWRSATASDRADAKGDLTGANIAGIQQAPAGSIDLSSPWRRPIFVVKLTRGPAATVTGVSYRWIFSDSQDKSYKMTNTSGEDLSDFSPAENSVIAVFHTPTRDLLKQRAIKAGNVVCRATSPVFGDKVFKLPVMFL